MCIFMRVCVYIYVYRKLWMRGLDKLSLAGWLAGSMLAATYIAAYLEINGQ